MSNPCIKCKYYEHPGLTPMVFCKHPKALVQLDPVTGAKKYLTCRQMRYEYTCGAEGVHFEKSKRNTLFIMIKYWFLN